MTENRERVSGASQSTDSGDRLLRRGRTEGLTKNLQDQGDSLTFLNAHEASEEIAASWEARFWSKVDVTGACWIWTAAKARGYGMFKIAGRGRRAHRVAYETLVGPIPDGYELDHLCRVKSCVNPDHLEPVTHRENSMRSHLIRGVVASRTHCKNGHLFDEANTFTTKRKSRACRTCHRDRQRERQARLSAAAETLSHLPVA